jgi:hypothetical protein
MEISLRLPVSLEAKKNTICKEKPVKLENNNCKQILKMFIKSRSASTRIQFILPKTNSNFVKFSFITISTKILILFLFNQLSNSNNTFKTFLKNNLIKYFNSSESFWT